LTNTPLRGFIQPAEVHGFELILTSGDVDIKLSVDAPAFSVYGA
jgi:hypothetical protein